ncbi:MAG: hypothetical protein ACXVWU_09470 [Nocardioides sp.]
MNAVLVLVAAMVFPLACLGLLLWLTWLEDTLPVTVARHDRRPEPPPILAMPVRPRPPVARVPVQRTPYDVLVDQERQTPEVSRSEALSLGGSTNR